MIRLAAVSGLVYLDIRYWITLRVGLSGFGVYSLFSDIRSAAIVDLLTPSASAICCFLDFATAPD